ncbi:MAG: diguanylate cyclase [Deltaproteobacteria bacterium]|nr:diguanylate cyclase [Deltaproteobacteria bacterium]
MKRIRDAVLKAIYRSTGDDGNLIKEFDGIVKSSGKQAYSVFFNVLTHLELKPEAAESCWKEVVDHRDLMAGKLGRAVNLRTAICDYFCSIDKAFKNPVVVELHVFEDQLESFRHDALTGLYTRGTFEETLKREVSRARRYETQLTIIFFDLDDFKKVNDTYGHPAGDMVLKEVSKTVTNMIRAEDSASRYGGEEIVLLLPNTGKVEALILGERIREKVEALCPNYEGNVIQTTISGGLATYPIDADTPENLLKNADSALYRAKDFGKNNVTVYSHDKRRYLRVHFFSTISIRQIGHDEHIHELAANTKNISVAGLLFESKTYMEIGSKVQLKIPMDGDEQPLYVIGTVVRIEVFDSGRYDIGVSFLEMDRNLKNEISRYMIHQLERVRE